MEMTGTPISTVSIFILAIKLRHRAAASDIDLAQLARLPYDAVVVEQLSHFPDELCRSVVGSRPFRANP